MIFVKNVCLLKKTKNAKKQNIYRQNPTTKYKPKHLPVQGALKIKMTDPYVVGWFLEDPKSTRVGRFFPRFFIVFFNSPHRKTPKNVITKSRKNRLWIFWSIF
jgi:hypothetical protein